MRRREYLAVAVAAGTVALAAWLVVSTGRRAESPPRARRPDRVQRARRRPATARSTPADGTGRRRLTYGAPRRSSAYSPTWSPDGRWIAFSRNGIPSEESGGVYVVSPDGRRLRHLAGTIGQPVWSPDGRWVAFSAGDGRVYRIRPGGSDLRLVARDMNGGLAWLPVGERLSFVRGSETDVVDADGRELRRLAGFGAWSPDGVRFASSVRRPHAASCGSAAVFVSAADGSARRRVTPDGQAYLFPTWSPDGTWIAFVNLPRCGYANTAVSIAAADGSGMLVLTGDGPPWPGSSLAWRP